MGQRSGELLDGEKATEVFLFVLFVFGKEGDIATGFLCWDVNAKCFHWPGFLLILFALPARSY